MSSHKHIDLICIVITIIAAVITVIFMNGDRIGIISDVDKDIEWNESVATDITLKNEESSIKGGGAYAYDGNIYITESGYYIISGRLTDGQIIIDAHKNSGIHIRFDGVNIQSSKDEVLHVVQAGKVYLTLAEGTENVLESDSTLNGNDSSGRTRGAIHSADDLIINGTGILTVESGNGHGIEVNDSLTISGGKINIVSMKDGINVNNKILINDGSLNILAEDDGIDCKGDVIIDSGIMRVSVPGDGTDQAIEAGGKCRINGGDLIACGSFSTAYPFDEISDQCSVLYRYPAGFEGNTSVTLADEEGEKLLEWNVPYGFSAVFLSHPALTKGISYDLAIGELRDRIQFEATSESILY